MRVFTSKVFSWKFYENTVATGGSNKDEIFEEIVAERLAIPFRGIKECSLILWVQKTSDN